MNNIKVVTFSKIKDYFSPTQEVKFIPWGKGNKMPYELLDLYDNVPEHSAAIEYIKKNILGIGLQDQNIDYWTLTKMVVDYVLFGGFTLEVVKTRNGINTISYVDTSNCRLSKDKKSILYSENWNDYKPEYTSYTLTNTINVPGIFYFKGVNSRDDYPKPYYNSALTNLETSKEIIKFHNNNAKHGFSPSILVNYNGDVMEEEQDNIVKDFKKNYTSAEGEKIIFAFNASKEAAVEITKLQADNLDEKFESLQKFVMNQTLIAHQITGILIGVAPESTVFSKSEYEEALVIFKEIVVSNFRNELEYALEVLLQTPVKFVDKNNTPTV